MIATLEFPKTDTGLLQWSQNVVDLITPVPATWGLVVGDVTSYTSKHDAYAAALSACAPPARNKTAVATKRQAILDLKSQAAVVANKVYAASTVTTAMKVQIGMPPRQSPTQIPVPSTAPVIEVISSANWTVRI